MSVSVVMTTYNGERFIREQLDSIINQTVKFDELIICDDCSTDGTIKILHEYSERDSRIKIFENEKQLGSLRNFEKALGLSKGDFVALSDQDDIWKEDHLEILLNNIGGKSLSVGNAEIIEEDGKKTGVKLSYVTNLDYVPDSDVEKAFFIFFFVSQYHGMTMLLGREFIQKALPIPKQIRFHDIWLGSLACFYGGLNYTYDIVTYYRRLSTSLSGRKRRQSVIKVMLAHIVRKERLVNEQKLLEQIKLRLGDSLNTEQKKFIRKADKYFNRRRHFMGRMINVFFELKNLKKIYGIQIFKQKAIKR